MPEQHILIWDNCLSIIKDNVNKQSFKTWFEPIRPLKLNGSILTIQVPSLFFYEWLEEHYVTLLKKTIKKEIGTEAKLEYSIVVDASSKTNGSTISMPQQQPKNDDKLEVNMPMNISDSIKNPFVIPGLKKVNIDSQLNQNFTFDTFIEGECNRLARSTGIAISEKPGGTSFNPFFIYGGVGLGKTHLVQAIGNRTKELFSNKAVLYVTSERFTNQFVEAVKNKSLNDFLNFYQLIDVLIIDDVQFFARKEKTQEIFFNIFNHLHQNGKQLILTSDRPPKDMEGLEERLLSRFKWGLSVDLQIPDFETRVAILEEKMHADGIELKQEVIEYIANHVTSSIRELEGALISTLAHASFDRKEIDLPLVKNILNNIVTHNHRELSIEFIANLVGDYFDVEIETLKSKTRKRNIVQARQISMHLAKSLTEKSLASIGKFFGGRDHSTVIHACSTVSDLMETDSSFKDKVIEIQRQIEANYG